jgi:hypothetical protein
VASALAFGATFSRAGWTMGALRIAHRVWQVYWTHIGVFFATLFLVLALNATGIVPRDEVGALNLHSFLRDAGLNLLGLMTLTYAPNYFDILPMYLVILAMIPAMAALARVDVRLALLASVALWAAATAGLNLPAELWFPSGSDRRWFFNPFAWQIVFFTGYALAAGWLPRPPVRRELVALAALIVLVSAPFASHRIHAASTFLTEWRHEWSFLFAKSDLGVLRYAHFLAVAYLAWAAAGEGGRRLRRTGRAGAAIAVVSQVGQQSLAVFAASMVLARLLGAALALAGGGALATLVVNLAGFAAIIAVARTAALFKAKPWSRAAAQSSPAVMPTGAALARS